MSYRPWLEEPVLRQLPGLPEEGFATLVRTLSQICEAPRDRTFSVPLSADGRERLAELDDGGFIEFTIDEPAALVRVFRLVWTG